MQEPFAMFPRRLLRAGLSPREQSVLLCLISYKNNDKEAWPSRKAIANDTGIHVSHVHKAVKSLAQKGMIAMNTQSGVRTVYTFPCLDHTAQNLDMVAHAPVIAKSAKTENVPTQQVSAPPVRTLSETVSKTETLAPPATADNLSPVEQSGNSGMLPEPPAVKPAQTEVNTAPLSAIVMAGNAKPHNVTDAFMQELNARPIVQPKPDNADLMERAHRLAALQAENSARSRAEKLAERRRVQDADIPDQDAAKTEELAAKHEELAAKHEELDGKHEEQPLESVSQPAQDASSPIVLPAPVVVHESHDSAPQQTLPIICAPQTAAPVQGELLPANIAGQGELPPAQQKKKRGRPKTEGHRIPDNWCLTINLVIWAKEKHGFDDDTINFETEKFIDHWKASANENAWKSDWDAAWRTWMRNVKTRPANGNGYGNQQKSKTMQVIESFANKYNGDFGIPF